ncbi:P74 [Neodiprion sertifer nucleopolyhedrovirus]|uniref:p74 n=1 Tax=Neodiprion sertifer nucleopolyhedrovirus TaxID=111874 RepID=Q6JKB0_9CBAC|nr:P74 [Neodiprion sertifer nucleopolyhedrovirus]AAQ96427.1 P74 [Neodiprion sertifer nucleopolyhedrovirus]
MATITSIDIQNASLYATHLSNLKYIRQWRTRFPNIFIDYSIKCASNDDYYVPTNLKNKAITVDIAFSEKGCEQINCYPYTETKPIDVYTEFGYTQTSDVAIPYGQPACYNIDAASARKSGAEALIQSLETRYFNDKCILMDSTTKLWFNSPYVRTSEHTTKGVDDVSGFNVAYNTNDNIPETYSATFNEAYCNRFGRDVSNNGCSYQWWETFIGVILGESIYATFKQLATGSGVVPSTIDYDKPSELLPEKPLADAYAELYNWTNAVDTTIDEDFESLFDTYSNIGELGLSESSTIVYIAQNGIHNVNSRTMIRKVGGRVVSNTMIQTRSDQSIEDMMVEFFDNFPIFSSLLIDIGYSVFDDAFRSVMKKIATKTTPYFEKMLLTSSITITKRLLGNTLKAAMFHQLNTFSITLVSTVAKAIARFSAQASSVVGIALAFLSIADIVLSFWDPYGYANMFTPEYLSDVSLSFLEAFYTQNGTRDLIEINPAHYSSYVDVENSLLETFSYILEYVANLEINSDGQLLDFENDTTDFTFDSENLTSIAVARLSAYDSEDFDNYTKSFNEILQDNISTTYHNQNLIGIACTLVLSFILSLYNSQYFLLFVLLLTVFCILLYNNTYNIYQKLASLLKTQ